MAERQNTTRQRKIRELIIVNMTIALCHYYDRPRRYLPNLYKSGQRISNTELRGAVMLTAQAVVKHIDVQTHCVHVSTRQLAIESGLTLNRFQRTINLLGKANYIINTVVNNTSYKKMTRTFFQHLRIPQHQLDILFPPTTSLINKMLLNWQ